MKEIKELIEALDQSSIAKLKWVQGDYELKLEKEKQQVSAVAMPQVASPVTGSVVVANDDTRQPSVEVPLQHVAEEKKTTSTVDVLAPLVGVFYQASSPEADPFVKVGQHVDEGETVCILEAMKVLNEIKAPKSGTVVAIHVENGDVAEFNQVLMEIGD